MTFPITSLYAALCGLIVLALAVRVIARRRAMKIGIGVGQDKELERFVRAHANAIEYLPIALIVLALCEARGLAAPLLHTFGVALVLGRVLHAQGLSRRSGVSFGRFWGLLLNLLMLLLASLALLLSAIGAI